VEATEGLDAGEVAPKGARAERAKGKLDWRSRLEVDSRIPSSIQ